MVSMYYVLNFLLIGIYPLTRAFRLFNFYYLDQPDELGTTRENMFFYTAIAFAIFKYVRSYSVQEYLSSLFFTLKLTLISSYLFVNPKICLMYAGACLIIWLICSQPKYSGKSKMKEIDDIEEFEEIVGVRFRDNDDGDIIEELNERFKKKSAQKEKTKKQQNYKQTEMVFAEFYVDWADTCNFTKEIWAGFSCKYSTAKLKFISINLAKIPRLAECYRINTSSMSRQLPTVIMLEDGEEVSRFPPIDEKTNKIPKVLKYGRKELMSFFDLEKRYLATRDL